MTSKLFIASVVLGAFLLGGLVVILWVNRPGAATGNPDSSDTQEQAKKDDPPQPSATPQGKVVKRDEVSTPPPAPKKVGNPDRVRQNLRPGKTYVTHSRGTLNVRGEDKSWGLGRVVTINYAFEARIDRQIESNDGVRIVELRRFRDVRAVKATSQLEDLRLELGDRAGSLLTLLGAIHPKARAVAFGVKALDGLSAQPLLKGLRWIGVKPEEISGLDASTMKVASQVNELSGKAVRLTFVDGAGVTKIEAVRGEITGEERRFHLASSVLSDSLIFPNTDVKIGVQWTVDGENFANLLDPAMLSRTSGEVTLERAADRLVHDKPCSHLRVVEGRLEIKGSDDKEEQLGHFDPQGSLFFSRADQVIIEARLKGKAKLERFSTNHLLFESRMRRQPDLDVRYSCKVTDTKKGK